MPDEETETETGGRQKEGKEDTLPGQKKTTYKAPAAFANFTPSPKRRAAIEQRGFLEKRKAQALFTEEFFYRIIPSLGMALVYVVCSKTGMNGWVHDIRTLLDGSDVSPVADRSRSTFQNVFGPFSQVGPDGDLLREEKQNRDGSTSKYPKNCFVLIPTPQEDGTFDDHSIQEEIKRLAEYCNRVYHANMERRRTASGGTYSIMERTFGPAAMPNLTGTDDQGTALSDYISRRHCIQFIQLAYGGDSAFYSNNEEKAVALMKPPYQLPECITLGYPHTLFVLPEGHTD